MKLVYKCKCDGTTCGKEIPKLDEFGTLIEPKASNEFGDWEVCKSCDRNHCDNGECFGRIIAEP